MNLFVVQIANGGEQTWAAACRSSSPTPAAGPLRGGRAPLPALRRRGDPQPRPGRWPSAPPSPPSATSPSWCWVGQRVDGRTGGFWLSLLATALVALAFQPLRRQVGPAGQPAGLRSARPALRGAVGLQPPARGDPDPGDTAAGGRRRPPGRRSPPGARPPAARPGGCPGRPRSWGTRAGRRCARGGRSGTTGRAGQLRVARPRTRTSGPSDARLLEALADQTAVAFRNAALRPAGRTRGRARPDHEELAGRGADHRGRRRGPQTLEAAISRDVLPYLVSHAPACIAGPGRPNAAGQSTTPASTALVAGTNTRARGAARAHPRGVPHPAGPVRARAGPALPPGAQRPGGALRSTARSPGGGSRPGRGRGLLLQRRGRHASSSTSPRSSCPPRRTLLVRRTRDRHDDRRPPGDPRPRGGPRRVADAGTEELAVRIPAVEDAATESARSPAEAAAQASASRSGPKAALATYVEAPQPSRSNSSSS